MLGRDLAVGDADVARDARLGVEQVVVVHGVEHLRVPGHERGPTRRPARVVDPEASGQPSTGSTRPGCGVVEGAEVHPVQDGVRLGRH
ncbi:hypothetical protein ASD90_08840 [Terrabacter sp. Root181]|nr:hypothetical protein ASD90_08840 [Terrabacter sp. Root181]